VAIYATDHWQSSLLIGVDLDFVSLRLAARHYPNLVQANIQYLPFSTPFDLILIRHPNIDKQRYAWQKAIFNLPVTNDGVVVITVYSIAEAEQIRDWFSSLSFSTLTLNTSRLHPPYLDGRDRFVMSYRCS
jgi:hypothetical protein